MLDPDVRIHAVAGAADGFDARFSALWRRYAYRVADQAPAVDPLTRGHVLAWPRALDEDAMNAAAALLVGEHDFAAFCRKREGATTTRTLLDLGWTRDGGLLVADVRADAFCHNMVRALVGCMLSVGEGRHAAGVGARRTHGRRAGPGGDGGARARAHPRGGAVPARRRAGREGARLPTGARSAVVCGAATRQGSEWHEPGESP